MCSLVSYIVLLVPTVAIAWDADGFRSGSPVADIERELAAGAFIIVLSQEDGKLEASKRYENVALKCPCLAK